MPGWFTQILAGFLLGVGFVFAWRLVDFVLNLLGGLAKSRTKAE